MADHWSPQKLQSTLYQIDEIFDLTAAILNFENLISDS